MQNVPIPVARWSSVSARHGARRWSPAAPSLTRRLPPLSQRHSAPPSARTVRGRVREIRALLQPEHQGAARGSVTARHASTPTASSPLVAAFRASSPGVPEIDPSVHTLTIHGMVAPLVFGVDEIDGCRRRRAFISRVLGKQRRRMARGSTESDVQRIHGLTSCSEWTGVPVSMLLRECGVDPAATGVLAEGADAGKHDRSIPMKKMMDDAMIVYGQNGEPLRPEQGARCACCSRAGKATPT